MTTSCTARRAPLAAARVAAEMESGGAGAGEIDLSQWRSDTNKTGYMGVRQKGDRFKAEVRVPGKGKKHLGTYGTAEEAAEEAAVMQEASGVLYLLLRQASKHTLNAAK